MERKIIGYKLKYPEWKCAALEIANISCADKIDPDESYDLSVEVHDISIPNLQKAGVLDLWFEPIYEEPKFNVGDWVVVLDTPYIRSWFAGKDAVGHIFQITSDKKYYEPFIIGEASAIDPSNKYKVNYRLDDVRLATPEEIESVTKSKEVFSEEQKEYINESIREQILSLIDKCSTKLFVKQLEVVFEELAIKK